MITRLLCKPFPCSTEPSFLCALSAYTVKDAASLVCGSCIIDIMAMRLEKLRQVDLNLLITFAAIAEEKSVNGGSVKAIAEPARCQPSSAARTRAISR
jgi:hypothetical protein